MTTNQKQLAARAARTLILCGAAFAALGCDAENIVPSDVGVTPDTTPSDTTPSDTTPGDTTTDTVDPGGACDLTGTWAIQVWTINEPELLALAAACATNTYYGEIVDSGDSFVFNRGASCSYRVDGIAEVVLEEETKRSLLRHSEASLIDQLDPPVVGQGNSQVGRGGRFIPDGAGGCTLELDRWWLARGLDLDEALPDVADYSTLEDPVDVPDRVVVDNDPDGTASQPGLPPEGYPLPGIQNWDEELSDPNGKVPSLGGYPGISLNASAPISGWRVVVQRDWTQVLPGTRAVPVDRQGGDYDYFIAPLQFSNAEGVVAALDSNGTPNSALYSRSSAAVTSDTYGHYITFRKLPESMPTTNEDDMYDYCEEVVNPAIPVREGTMGSPDSCCRFPLTPGGNDTVGIPDDCRY